MEKIFIGEIPDKLSNKETEKLFEQMNNGSIKAKEKLILHNLRLVLFIIKRYNVELDKSDLFSIGNIGLIKAVDTYNLDAGYKFSTYAVKCINNEILMFLNNDYKIKKYEESLEKDIYSSKNNKRMNLEDMLESKVNLVSEYEKSEREKRIKELVERLPERDKKIITMYFGFNNDLRYGQDKIAESFDLSQSYISRIIKNSLKKIAITLEEEEFISINSKVRKKLKIVK